MCYEPSELIRVKRCTVDLLVLQEEDNETEDK
jgi:hypothetical protein